MRSVLSILALLMIGCANGPTVIVRSDGTVIANLGQQLFEDTTNEQASIVLPDGTQITHQKEGKVQSKVPNTYIGYKTVTGLASLANDGEAIREKGSVKRAETSASVDKARIEADVTKATFVPPE
jgi:hypothetical protein